MTSIDLTDQTYEALLRAATEQGVTPAEWIASALSHSETNSAHMRIRKHRHASGDTSINTADIDADLIREYEARFGHTRTNGAPPIL
ncbi:MAG: hypothetical protein ABIY70_06685 [Capsulimonas sp.]|uniref:hypothetical protein n=1 Tax=Capsulimonas sp. TaxID=2494211 RepID=UPI003262E405